jgi:hypothetical protein
VTFPTFTAIGFGFGFAPISDIRLHCQESKGNLIFPKKKVVRVAGVEPATAVFS